MPRIGLVPSTKGTVYAAQLAEALARKYNSGAGDPNWRAEGIVPDAKGGYKIEYVNVAEERKKAEEAHAKRSQSEREHVAKITLQEGKAVSTHPAFKNFENPNGLRPQTRAFLAAYNSVFAHPKSAGAADVDLINSYVRATSGGKVTEGEIHALLNAKNIGEKLTQIKDKPTTGGILAQSQRDQMLRTMLEMHNDAATASNEVMMTARDRMIEGGQTNEIHLPHPYVNNLMLISDAKSAISKNDITYKQLKEEKNAAIRSGDAEEIASIEAEMRHIVESTVSLRERLKKERHTSSPILGIHDFHTKRQGYVGGTGGVLDLESIQSSQQK
jgi:hypothetical protein